MKLKTTILLAFIAITQSLPSASTLLDFENPNGVPNGAPNQNYGDRLVDTPNIDLNYFNLFFNCENEATYSLPGKCNAINTAPAPNASIAKIVLTPDTGFGVTLNSLDLGVFYALGTTNVGRLNLRDSSDNLLLNIFSGTTNARTFNTNFSQPGALTIEFGDGWNIGVDNINFSQYRIVTTSGVPEPSTYALFLAGSAALFCLRRRSA